MNNRRVNPKHLASQAAQMATQSFPPPPSAVPMPPAYGNEYSKDIYIKNQTVKDIYREILMFLDRMSLSIDINDLFVLNQPDMIKLLELDIKIEHILQSGIMIINATTKETNVALCMDHVVTFKQFKDKLDKLNETHKLYDKAESQIQEYKGEINKIMDDLSDVYEGGFVFAPYQPTISNNTPFFVNTVHTTANNPPWNPNPTT